MAPRKRRRNLNLNEFRFDDGGYRRFLDGLFEHLSGVQREHALLKTYQHIISMLDERITGVDDDTAQN